MLLRRTAHVLAVLGCAAGLGPAAAAADVRYSPAGGCWAVRDVASDRFLVRDGDGFRAGARSAAEAEPFRFQATRLGHYLLFTKDARFLSADGTRVVAAGAPSGDGDWKVEPAGGERFVLVLPESGQRLAVGGDGALGAGRQGTPLALAKADGCARYPESEVNVAGEPYRGPSAYGEAKGLIDTHLHLMAFESFGGSVHCGRPWHPYGITHALVDCPDHGPNGQGALAENFLANGDPTRGHDTDGWPTFKGWPHHRTYVHEQSYYKNLERAWRGGTRLITALLVDNSVLCEVYPLKRNTCNEMDNVRLQARNMFALQDYVDAQSGGPGKGWLRIVKDPFEARRVINRGKLAIVLGIETSKLFDCGEYNRVPECTREMIDAQLEEMHAVGVRQIQLVNKFDNALVGVAGDDGTFGVLTTTANRYETGHHFAMETCMHPTAEHDHDKEQSTQSEHLGRDALLGATLQLFAPPGTLPVYPPSPHCNVQGLTELGAYTIRRVVEKQMIFDPDHMSVLGRDQALALIESMRYGGVLSSHSWSTPDSYRRILALGGLVTPAPKTSEGFVRDWKDLRVWRNPRYLFGTGFSTDMAGFAAQGGPRETASKDPLPYPFKSLDGATTIDRQRVGERTYDLNADGTAHYGLYVDRVADVAHIGGADVARDLVRGAEAYLQMWERAEGVPGPACRAAQRRFTARGLGEMRVGMRPVRLLRSAGQPERRVGRRWTYCARGAKGGRVRVAFDRRGRVALVGSTARLHRARGAGAGSPVARIRRATRRFGPGLRVARTGRRGTRLVYGVRRGRVTFAGVAGARAARSPRRLAAFVRLARLR
ncbi:MAG TPA: Coagulation factor 5/8 type domain-containing protein [Solirubrobacteraceae bacterium]|nr:Coagulation factor 5/8 type domain-containing protein [Solirubrobacteraceae bacterium]